MADTREMVAVMTSATDAFPSVQDEREHVALLRDDPAFAAVPDPELERWIGAVQRQTDVACAALSLVDGARQIMRQMAEATRSEPGGKKQGR